VVNSILVYYSSDDNYGMNEYGMNGTPIRNGNSFVGSLGGITHSVREDGFVDYGVKNMMIRVVVAMLID
jgi:hypothetical protein